MFDEENQFKQEFNKLVPLQCEINRKQHSQFKSDEEEEIYEVELAKAIKVQSKWREDFYNYILKGEECKDIEKGITIWKGGLQQIANETLKDNYPVTEKDVFRNLFMACCNEIRHRCGLYEITVNEPLYPFLIEKFIHKLVPEFSKIQNTQRKKYIETQLDLAGQRKMAMSDSYIFIE